MERQSECIKEYSNGNITIKYNQELIEKARDDPALVLSEVLFWMDCYIEEDEGLSLLIHNVNKDVWYRLYRYPVDDMERLMSGKTLRLISFKRKVA